mgnify:CR=1 FL=1
MLTLFRQSLAPAKILCALVLVTASLSLNLAVAQTLAPRDDPKIQRVEPFQVFDNLYYVGAKWVPNFRLYLG